MRTKMDVQMVRETGWCAEAQDPNCWEDSSKEAIFKRIYKENFKMQFTGSSFYRPYTLDEQKEYDEWYSKLTWDDKDELEEGLEQVHSIDAEFED